MKRRSFFELLAAAVFAKPAAIAAAAVAPVRIGTSKITSGLVMLDVEAWAPGRICVTTDVGYEAAPIILMSGRQNYAVYIDAAYTIRITSEGAPFKMHQVDAYVPRTYGHSIPIAAADVDPLRAELASAKLVRDRQREREDAAVREFFDIT